MKQDAKARWQLRSSQKTDIRKAVKEAHIWLQTLSEGNEVHVWCRGLNFDIPKFERCIRSMLEEELPYKWWNLEDARTYAHAFGVHNSDIEFQGIPHSAEDDCRHQISVVQEAYRRRQLMRYHAAQAIVASCGDDTLALAQQWKKTFGEQLSEEDMNGLLN